MAGPSAHVHANPATVHPPPAVMSEAQLQPQPQAQLSPAPTEQIAALKAEQTGAANTTAADVNQIAVKSTHAHLIPST